MARRVRLMHLDTFEEGESFMTREGVSPEGDDIPEWLDNERNNPLENDEGDLSEEIELDEPDEDDDEEWKDEDDGDDE